MLVESLGARHGIRLSAALVVSLSCHALVLLWARGWRTEMPARPLVVTMIASGSGGDEGRSNAGAAPVAAAPPAPSTAAVVPVEKKVAPAPRPIVRRETVAPAVAERRPAASAPSAADAVARPAVGEHADGASGAGGVSNAGPGAAGSGGGTGGGAGGSDGLRVLCRDCPAPEYPGRARRQGWQGNVDVELTIARDGSVADARVGRSSGYPTLDEVALAAARRSRFATASDGLRGELRYHFVLDETAARR